MAAKVKIPYYSVRRNGRGFWEPRPHMRALGFYCVPCGQDGPDAWAIAEEWNRRWQAVKSGEAPSPVMAAAENLSPECIEELTVYPPRSLGEAFRRYRRTNEWESKAPRTREDWWRGWRQIKPVFGDVDRGHQRVAQNDRGHCFAPRSAPLLEDLARHVEGCCRARLLRSRCRSRSWRAQPSCTRAKLAMVRGRSGAAGQAGLAQGISWACRSYRRCMGHAIESRRCRRLASFAIGARSRGRSFLHRARQDGQAGRRNPIDTRAMGLAWLS